MRKIPYGISNFQTLITEGYLYVDKTPFIRRLEAAGKYAFFVRPRRFGKSLFVSALTNYYDLAQRDKFETLFGSLDIGGDPTENRNSYLVLPLDFAAVTTGQGTEVLRRSFDESVAYHAHCFFRHYRELFGGVEVDLAMPAESALRTVLASAAGIGERLYVLIDEYDNFANDLLARGESQVYRDMLHATGFVRTFYKALKSGTTSVIDRIFVTGVSPVMLDDVTSGFNIARNLTLERAFHDTFGFTEAEVLDLIRKLELPHDEQSLLSDMAALYDGYRFHRAAPESLYNSDMVLHYLLALSETGECPEQLIDHNVRTDYGRLRSLVLTNGGNAQSLDEILAEESIAHDLVPQFSFERMLDSDHFVSLLFYLGLLTIEGVHEGTLCLRIPNYGIKTVYWEYFRKLLEERHKIPLQTDQLTRAIRDLAWRGNPEPFARYVAEQVVGRLSRRDFRGFGEKHLKVICFSLLGLTEFYFCHSETEVEHGFLDLFLSRDPRQPDVPFEWLIELKYLKEEERERLADVRRQAAEQLQRYAGSAEVRRRYRGDEIRMVALVFVGKGQVELVSLPAVGT